MLLGIISDIHEDIVSLRKAFSAMEKKGCSEIVCLGDITGFEPAYYDYAGSRDANKCVAAVRANCRYVVTGNHDLFSIEKIPVNLSGFEYPGNWYSLNFSQRMSLSNSKVWLYENALTYPSICKDNVDFLRELPEFLITEFDGVNILLSHSVFPDPTGSLTVIHNNPWNFIPHFEVMYNNNCFLSLTGHLHPGKLVKIEKNNISFYSRKTKTRNNPCIFIMPSVAAGRSENGFAVFNTKDLSIEILKIKSGNEY